MLPLLAIPTLAIGGLSLWAGRGARREEERHDAQLADAAPAPGAITRREFDRRMETMRLATKGQMPWVIAAFVAAIGGTIAIAVLGERFDWPEWTGAAGFAWFWAGIGGLTWWGARTSKRISKEFELECPACARPFYGAFISSRAQTLLDTLGRCPRCAARVIVEDY